MPCGSQAASTASRSAACPYRSATITAAGGFPRRAATCTSSATNAGSAFHETRSESTKTGAAPSCTTGLTPPTKVSVGASTSSPGRRRGSRAPGAAPPCRSQVPPRAHADPRGELALEGVDVRPERREPVAGNGLRDEGLLVAADPGRGEIEAAHARRTRAGTPKAVAPAGTSSVTKLQAPTTAPSPTVTPGITTQWLPIRQLRRSVTGPALPSMVDTSRSRSATRPAPRPRSSRRSAPGCT